MGDPNSHMTLKEKPRPGRHVVAQRVSAGKRKHREEPQRGGTGFASKADILKDERSLCRPSGARMFNTPTQGLRPGLPHAAPSGAGTP